MSESSRPRPVPGPPGGPAARPVPAPPAGPPRIADEAPGTAGTARLGGLHERPVAEHVDVFEAEHARLERELRTIDQL